MSRGGQLKSVRWLARKIRSAASTTTGVVCLWRYRLFNGDKLACAHRGKLICTMLPSIADL